jgi:hypothetical protein
LQHRKLKAAKVDISFAPKAHQIARSSFVLSSSQIVKIKPNICTAIQRKRA